MAKSVEQEYLDNIRDKNRIVAMLPLTLIIFLLVAFLGGRKFFELSENGISGKLILLGIIAAIIGVSYLLSGVMIPKR